MWGGAVEVHVAMGTGKTIWFSYPRLLSMHSVGLSLEPNSEFLSQSVLRTLFKCTREVSLVESVTGLSL